MKEYLTLGSAPTDEDCVQVSDREPYIEAMTAECRRYKSLLQRLYPIPEGVNAEYIIKRFSHDFGGYKEVCITFDDEDETASEFAYNVENNLPEVWEDEIPEDEYEKSRKIQCAECGKQDTGYCAMECPIGMS